MSSRGRWGRVAAALLATATVSILIASPSLANPPVFSSLLRTKPYVPLFSETGDCAENKSVNQLTGSALSTRLSDLTRWFVHFQAQGSSYFLLGTDCQGASSTTLASKLSGYGAWTSNYRNGSFVSQSSLTQPLLFREAQTLEQSAPLAILTFWPGDALAAFKTYPSSTEGTLPSAVDANTTTIRVIASGARRPVGAPTTWPYMSSRGTGLNLGAFSQNTHDFVSWIRLDNEIMQIVANPVESGGIVTLTVRRSIWGTAKTVHAAGAKMMVPTYIGNTNSAPQDDNNNGAPIRDDSRYPLRYAIRIWQPDGYNWIADRIAATIVGQGYNTIWLDVSSCNMYNQASADGRPVWGFDSPQGKKLTSDQWGAYQKVKLQGLRGRFPGMRFTGNSLSSTFDACTENLIGNAYDGGVLEHWMKSDPGWLLPLNWPAAMDQTFKIQQGNWPAIYWVRWNFAFLGDPAQYKRFSYGSLLLAYRKTATRFQYGGPFGLNQPDELFFWDWGTPQGLPTSISSLQVPGLGLYRRDYSNGIVVVNPGTTTITYNLGATFYDVIHKTTSGQPKAVTSITLGPKDAAFLLRSI